MLVTALIALVTFSDCVFFSVYEYRTICTQYLILKNMSQLLSSRKTY